MKSKETRIFENQLFTCSLHLLNSLYVWVHYRLRVQKTAHNRLIMSGFNLHGCNIGVTFQPRVCFCIIKSAAKVVTLDFAKLCNNLV